MYSSKYGTAAPCSFCRFAATVPCRRFVLLFRAVPSASSHLSPLIMLPATRPTLNARFAYRVSHGAWCKASLGFLRCTDMLAKASSKTPLLSLRFACRNSRKSQQSSNRNSPPALQIPCSGVREPASAIPAAFPRTLKRGTVRFPFALPKKQGGFPLRVSAGQQAGSKQRPQTTVGFHIPADAEP